MTIDRDIFGRAVNGLIVVLVLCVAGIIAITVGTDRSIPDILQNLASADLAGLIGLLVQKQPDGPVEVAVTESVPVAVAEPPAKRPPARRKA